MKRISIVGLSLFAVLAFSAIASSSAFAGEYGVCVKAAKETVEWKEVVKGKEKTLKKTVYTGAYSDKNCTEPNTTDVYRIKGSHPGPEGKYEWSPYPGPAGTNWSYTSTGKTAILSTSQGAITCTKNKDAGEVTGPKSDVDAVTFEDCTNSVFGTTCYNVSKGGKKGGTIDTFLLDTTVIDHGEKGASGGEPAEGEVWVQFTGTETVDGVPGVLAAFYCETPVGEDPFIVTGSVSGVQTGDVNVMSSKASTDLGAGLGEQDLITITIIDAPPYTEIGYFPSIQTGVDSIKSAAKVEIKA